MKSCKEVKALLNDENLVCCISCHWLHEATNNGLEQVEHKGKRYLVCCAIGIALKAEKDAVQH
jgi:hypothetical protein